MGPPLRHRRTDNALGAKPLLVEGFGSAPPGRALDLGAGEGRHAIWLATLGWHATAVDFSRVALSKGKRWAERLGVEVSWLVTDLTTFEPPPLFDFVLASFIHFAGPVRSRFLSAAAGALAPGGTLIVVGYDRSNAPAPGGGPLRNPDLLLSAEEVAAELSGAAGLHVERADRLSVAVAAKAGDAESKEPSGPSEVIDVFVQAVRPLTRQARSSYG